MTAKFRVHLQRLVARKAADEERMITKQEIHKQTDVSRPTIDDWLRGEVKMLDPSVLIKFARWLDVEPGELFEAIEDPELIGPAADPNRKALQPTG